jgi:hypothetical protein
MFWLVLYYTSVVVIPEKYPNLEQCQQAGQQFVQSKQFNCIPAAKSDKPIVCSALSVGSPYIICSEKE